MILAYGQDDRVCAYTSARAVLEVAGEVTDRTACCILVDKEEIGSVGATGMQSRFFENMTAELMELMGEYSELNLRRCLSNSTMLSSDVSAGYDPVSYTHLRAGKAGIFYMKQKDGPQSGALISESGLLDG